MALFNLTEQAQALGNIITIDAFIYLFLNTVNFAFKPLKRAPDKPPEMKKSQIELISFFKLCIELNFILRGTHAYVPITAINRNIGISIV